MIILDTITKKIEAVMSAAAATNQSPLVASYVDVNDTDLYRPGSTDTTTNGGTAVDVVFSSGDASVQRQIKYLSIYNADTATITITIRLNNDSTTRILVRIALAVGSTLFYTDGEGWRVMDANGAVL